METATISESYTNSRYLLCSPLQIDGKTHYLGNYDDEADAARAYDRVARVLGRPLNFPEENESEIVGPRSEAADQAVATAMEAAKTFLGTDEAKKAAERAAEVHSQKATSVAWTLGTSNRKSHNSRPDGIFRLHGSPSE